jgi:hypothetical protein
METGVDTNGSYERQTTNGKGEEELTETNDATSTTLDGGEPPRRGVVGQRVRRGRSDVTDARRRHDRLVTRGRILGIRVFSFIDDQRTFIVVIARVRLGQQMTFVFLTVDTALSLFDSTMILSTRILVIFARRFSTTSFDIQRLDVFSTLGTVLTVTICTREAK